jgi:hypothetical protein
VLRLVAALPKPPGAAAPEVLGIDDQRGRAEFPYHETWQRDN